MAVNSVWEDGPSRPILSKRLGNACGPAAASASHIPHPTRLARATPGNLPVFTCPDSSLDGEKRVSRSKRMPLSRDTFVLPQGAPVASASPAHRPDAHVDPTEQWRPGLLCCLLEEPTQHPQPPCDVRQGCPRTPPCEGSGCLSDLRILGWLKVPSQPRVGIRVSNRPGGFSHVGTRGCSASRLEMEGAEAGAWGRLSGHLT